MFLEVFPHPCSFHPGRAGARCFLRSGPGRLVDFPLLLFLLGFGIVVLAVFRRRFIIGEFVFFRDCGEFVQRLGMVGAHGWDSGGRGSPPLRRSRSLPRGRGAGRGGAGRRSLVGSCGLTTSRSCRCCVRLLPFFRIVNSVMVDANMEGASVGGVGLVFVLDGFGRDFDVHVFFRDIWQGGASTSLPRVSQGESLQKL